MSTHPAIWRLIHEGLLVIAKAKMAPIATSASPGAVFMVTFYPRRRIHSFVRLTVAPVEPDELREHRLVELPRARLWLVGARQLDPLRHLAERELAERDRRQQAGSPRVRVHRVGHLLYGAA